MRPFISVCIPAYNRSQFLLPLLQSICSSGLPPGETIEILICEDVSPQREKIREVVQGFHAPHGFYVKYLENAENLGYDGNVRNLIHRASGIFCFFMGNDDLMAPGAMVEVKRLFTLRPDLGFVLKSYAWFNENPAEPDQTIVYFPGTCQFEPGAPALEVCFRRSGVISGFIVLRDAACESATDKYDGTLYYQMHVAASVLLKFPAVSTEKVLVLSRATEAPDFGISAKEKGVYTPGSYTPEARVAMLSGIARILRDHSDSIGKRVVDAITRDYANYFYPYIKDQLGLSVPAYFRFYRSMASLGFGRYGMFHLYFLVAYILKEKGFDKLTKFVRKKLGHTPIIGIRRQ